MNDSRSTSKLALVALSSLVDPPGKWSICLRLSPARERPYNSQDSSIQRIGPMNHFLGAFRVPAKVASEGGHFPTAPTKFPVAKVPPAKLLPARLCRLCNFTKVQCGDPEGVGEPSHVADAARLHQVCQFLPTGKLHNTVWQILVSRLVIASHFLA